MMGTSMQAVGHEIDLGGVTLQPQRRAIVGPGGTAHVEPLVMRFLCTLAQAAERMVDRTTLFDACWAGQAVGDDSLNRLAAGARRALRLAGGEVVAIETVAGAGYILTLGTPGWGNLEARESAARAALAGGVASWRIGFPAPDWLAIARLKRAVESLPEHAASWGMLALMYRHAAEYADPGDQATLVGQCEHAARTALALDAHQPEAAVALTSVVPIFGNWASAHDRLSEILGRCPGNVIAAHDLAIVEMASGRVSAAKTIVDRLIAADPLAPTLGYKSTYHNWTTGDLVMMDKRADAMIQLWPAHPAVWTARFWTLAFTDREQAAQRMLVDAVAAPPLPAGLVAFFSAAIAAATGAEGAREKLVSRAVAAVTGGPAQAVNSLIALGRLDETHAAFAVADGFYTQSGAAAVPIHGDPGFRVNEMRRRLTQVLFTPACAAMRTQGRFADLCERTGLEAYWRETRRPPDYRVLRAGG